MDNINCTFSSPPHHQARTLGKLISPLPDRRFASIFKGQSHISSEPFTSELIRMPSETLPANFKGETVIAYITQMTPKSSELSIFVIDITYNVVYISLTLASTLLLSLYLSPSLPLTPLLLHVHNDWGISHPKNNLICNSACQMHTDAPRNTWGTALCIIVPTLRLPEVKSCRIIWCVVQREQYSWKSWFTWF